MLGGAVALADRGDLRAREGARGDVADALAAGSRAAPCSRHALRERARSPKAWRAAMRSGDTALAFSGTACTCAAISPAGRGGSACLPSISTAGGALALALRLGDGVVPCCSACFAERRALLDRVLALDGRDGELAALASRSVPAPPRSRARSPRARALLSRGGGSPSRVRSGRPRRAARLDQEGRRSSRRRSRHRDLDVVDAAAVLLERSAGALAAFTGTPSTDVPHERRDARMQLPARGGTSRRRARASAGAR